MPVWGDRPLGPFKALYGPFVGLRCVFVLVPTRRRTQAQAQARTQARTRARNMRGSQLHTQYWANMRDTQLHTQNVLGLFSDCCWLIMVAGFGFG